VCRGLKTFLCNFRHWQNKTLWELNTYIMENAPKRVANHAACAEALARAGCDVGLEDIDGETGRHIVAGKRAERLRGLEAERPTEQPVGGGGGGPLWRRPPE
jgi:hypothetical protein